MISDRTSEAGKRTSVRRLPALLAFSAALLLAAPASTEAAGPDTREAPPVSLIESADLMPTFTVWPGEGRVRVPGVYGTRRVKLDYTTREPVEVDLALASPILIPGRAAWGGGLPPRIALTFDDGPDSRYTPELLDILAKHNARATFFVLGALVEEHASIVRRMEEERHEIGIHTWWHADLTRLTDEAIASDLKRCQQALDAVIDRPIRWVRPPYGAVNSRVESVIEAKGYRVALWSVDPSDWRRPGASVIADRTLNAAHDGAVVLLHDSGGNRAGTVAAMRRVIPELQARGFELVTLSELKGLIDPPPAERGMIVTIGDERFEINARFDDVRVEVDGLEIELGAAPVMTRDQFLLPARPVLEALGARVGWDESQLAVTFEASRGDFVVRLNSLDVTRNGHRLFVQLPSVYYRGVAMVPAWLLANACRANVQYDAETRVIRFLTGAHTKIWPAQPPEMLTLRSMDGAIICGPRQHPRAWPGRLIWGANLSAAI